MSPGRRSWSTVDFHSTIGFQFAPAKKKRDDEDTENRCCDHAAEYRRAYGMTGGRAGTGGNDQWEQAKDKGEARHHNRPESQRRRFDRSRMDIFSELPLLHCKGNNKNAIFGS